MATSATKLSISGARDDTPGTLVSVTFSDGDVIKYMLSPTSPLYDDFAAHGFSKKLRDVVAGVETVAEAKTNIKAMLDAFSAGKWNLVRNNEGVPQGGLLAQALARKYHKSIDYAVEYVAKLSKKQQADMRKLPELASVIAEIQAEGKDSGAGDLLAAFATPSNGASAPEQE